MARYKAVNVTKYRFGANGCINFSRGFAILDTETNEFLSFNGRYPYVVDRKWVMDGIINDGVSCNRWVTRVKAFA